MSQDRQPALALESVTAGYGESTVLRDVGVTVGPGEVVALLGPNGAGKTTLLRAATGLLEPWAGTITVQGANLTGRPPHVFARRGVCHVPEGRGIFPSLTVLENLRIQARGRDLAEVVAEVCELFPALGSRLRQVAGSLSGGEQQMLALSRAWVTHPEVILVDEASLGLAPLVVDTIFQALGDLVRRGLSLVVVEQYVQRALALADTVYILRRGQIVHTGTATAIDSDEIYQRYLGVDA